MKQGDKVICIDDRGATDFTMAKFPVVKGHIYTITDVMIGDEYDHIRINGDSEFVWSSHRFISIKENRKKKLDKLKFI
jgi:hypothetical protein